MITKKTRIGWIVYSILFSFFYVLIYFIQKKNNLDRFDYLIIIFDIVAVSVLLYCSLNYLLPKIIRHNRIVLENNSNVSECKYSIIVAIILFIFWVPIFLAYYPGIFAYDVHAQVIQYKISYYSTHHPLAHSLYLIAFYRFGGEVLHNYNAGIALATLMQMIFFAFAISLIHLYLYKMRIRKCIRYGLILATALLPQFSIMSISLTKDVFFAGCFAVAFTYICCYYSLPDEYKKKTVKAVYVLSITGSILFRNNGIYPLAVLIIALSIQQLTKKRKQGNTFLLLTVLGLFIGLLINFSLKCILEADEGSINEAFSVPYQQLAYAYRDNSEEMPSDEKAAFLKIIPDIERYNPLLADEVKNTATGDKNTKEFLKLYLNSAIKYPKSFVKAFLQLDAGYLSITDNTYAEVYGVGGHAGMLLTDTNPGFDVYHISLLPFLESVYEKLYSNNCYQTVLGLNLLCKPAFYFWILIAALLSLIVANFNKYFPLILFGVVFLLTVLAGPCALVRYALPYILCVPSALSLNMNNKGII